MFEGGFGRFAFSMVPCKDPFRYLFLLPSAHRSRSQTDKATRTQPNRHPNVTGNRQTWNTTYGYSTSSTVLTNFPSKLHAVESCFACDAKSIDLSFAPKRHETIKLAMTLVIGLFLDMPGMKKKFPKQRNDGPLLSSKGQRALLITPIRRFPTSCEIVFLH